jgi:hypothetical protein
MENSNKKLVQYVRETKGRRFNQLRGVVVAIPDELTKFKCGWAYCNFSKGDVFSRERALTIALGRCQHPSSARMPADVVPVYKRVAERATRYFK